MKQLRTSEDGSLVLPLVLVVVALLGALGFGFWAFTGMQDYKNNSDKKAATASAAAVKAAEAKKDAEFAEKEKSPVKSYTGPATFGSIHFDYPKTWSAYIDEVGSSMPINGYFSPNFVPATASATQFAVRIQVVNSTYASTLRAFESNVKSGKSAVAAYRAPKVPDVLGSVVTGLVIDKKSGTMVILPLRDKTLKIWTEGSDFAGDFTNIVLASFTFVP